MYQAAFACKSQSRFADASHKGLRSMCNSALFGGGGDATHMESAHIRLLLQGKHDAFCDRQLLGRLLPCLLSMRCIITDRVRRARCHTCLCLW